MKHLLPFIIIHFFITSCSSTEQQKVDFIDIKAICDDIDFQFHNVKFNADSLKTYKQELILINDPLVTKKIINKSVRFKASNKKEIEKLLSNEEQRNLMKDLNDPIQVIN